MAVKRPAIITVVGILNTIFGSLGLLSIICCGPFSFFDTQQLMKAMAPQAAAAAQQPGNENPMANMKDVPGYMTFVSAGLAVSALTGSLLLASGIGLLRMKRWGRALGFTYAIVGILWGSGAAVINQKLVGPKIIQMYEKIQEDMSKAQAQARGGAVVPQPAQPKPANAPEGNRPEPAPTEHPVLLGVYFAVVLLFSLAFPIVELILMLLPAVGRGLAGVPDPAWQPDPTSLDDSGPDDGTWGETIRQ
jgi:hypothetical protein